MAPDHLIDQIEVEPWNKSRYKLRMLLWCNYQCFMAGFLSHVFVFNNLGNGEVKQTNKIILKIWNKISKHLQNSNYNALKFK